MNINYDSPFNFKPIPTITPASDYWQNGTWKFNMSEISAGATYQPSFIDVILHGNTALTLVNAKANSLEYLKLFGDTELLPETYLDTVTLSGGCRQSNLPEGYTQVEYLEVATTNTYFPTGINATIDTDMGITASNLTSNSAQILVAQCESGSDYFRIAKAGASQRIIGSLGSSTVTDNNTDGVSKFTARMNKSGFYVNGSLVGTFSNIPSSLTDIGKIDIFRGKYSNTTYFAYAGSRFHSAWVDDNIFLPCRRNSDNQLGIYNTKTGQFILPSVTNGFTAGPDVTIPSPDTPMDIVCNNGVIKYETYGLPAGYTKVEYLESSGTQYIDTGIVPTNTTGWKVTLNMPDVQNDQSKFGCRNDNSDTRFWLGCVNGKAYFGWGTNYPTSENRPSISANVENTVSCNYLNDRTCKLNGTIVYSNLPTLSFTPTKSIWLFGANTGTGAYRSYKVSEATFTEGNAIIMHLIPAKRNSDNVLGLYDTVGKTFLTNQGTGTFIAGTEQTAYVYTDGTVEVVTDSLGNTANAERLLAVGNYKDTQEVISGSVTRNVEVLVLDGTEGWLLATGTGYRQFYTSITQGVIKNSVSLVSNIAPYGCTAATRTDYDFGCYSGGTGYLCFQMIGSSTLTTVAEFKQFLANQYTNGTPVIIVYPLATATTETVTGQFLSKSPVTQTAGSISNLPIAITESQKTVPTPTNPLQINCNNGVVKVSKNLFNKSIFAEDSGTTAVYTSYQVPNGTYTMSSPDFPYTGSVTNVFFLAGNVSTGALSATNGVAINKPITITVTDGYYTVGHRYTSGGNLNNAHPIDYNWQIEKGSTATTYMPYGQIYVDGTTETVEITGKNLFDKSAVTANGYYNEDGVWTSSQTSDTSNWIPVQPSTQYTITTELATGSRIEGNRRFNYFDGNKTWLSQTVSQQTTNKTSTTITTPNNAKYIRCSWTTSGNYAIDNNTAQIEQGSTATTYEQYYNGGTATAEMLLKVGTYQDVQSVIDGGVTHNVGVKVLDGSEKWSLSGGYIVLSDFNFPIPNNGGYCTHFKTISSSEYFGSLDDAMRFGYTGNSATLFVKSTSFSTSNRFKQFLAQQYAQGTPVILVYPLATPTTETVTAQPMNIQEGTNIVEITQASMDGLELEVKYKAGVSVTIEEIENAQLDNNVEVTIQ